MNQKTVGLTLRAIFLALALILVAGPALPPLDGVAYAQTAAPTLTAVNAPGGGVQVSWTAVTGADSYELYKMQEGGSWSDAMSMTATSYTDTDVTAGATYFYIVRAVTGGTPGNWSNTGKETIPGGTAAPTGQPRLTATTSGTDAVDLSWTAVSDATSYDLRRWNPATSNWDPIGNNPTGTSYSDTGLAAGSPYHYVIRGVNAGGNGPWSSENGRGYASVTLPEPITATVPVLSLAHDERGVIELSWTAVAGAPTYELNRRKSTGSWVSVTLADDTATSHTDNVTDAGTYHYRVRAVTNNEGGSWSNEKSTVVPEGGRRPGKPVATATASGPDRIEVSWRAGAPDNATSYTVQWKSGSQDWSDSRQVSRPSKSFIHTELRAATEYTYRVQAENVNGAGDWSDEASDTTYASTTTPIDGRLGPPQNVRVEDKSTISGGVIDRKLRVSWSPVQDATHYQVYKWLDLDGDDEDADSVNTPHDWVQENVVSGTNPLGLVSGTHFDDDTDPDPSDNSNPVSDRGTVDLMPGTTYFYVVKAVVDVGGSLEHGEWSGYAMGTTKAYKPATPTLSAEVRGGNAIWLAWTVSSADIGGQTGAATGFDLEWRRSGSTASWTRFRDVTGRSYFHQNLRASSSYFYRVRAKNGSGVSDWTVVQEIKIPSQAKPATPTGVTVVDASDYDTQEGLVSKLKVSWNKVPGATSYEVQRWTEYTDGTWMWDQVDESPTDKTSLTVGGVVRVGEQILGSGETYHFVVRALNGGIAGDWSRSTYGTTRTELRNIDVPALTATTVGEKMIRLSWTDVPGATSYEIRFLKTVGSRALAERRPEDYTVISVDGMHFTHGGLTPGTQYEYNVRAVLPAGVYSNWSGTGETPERARTRPGRPSNFMVDDFNDTNSAVGTPASDQTPSNSFRLRWNSVAHDSGAPGSETRGRLDGPGSGTAGSYTVQYRVGTGSWADVSDATVGCTADDPATATDESAPGSQCWIDHVVSEASLDRGKEHMFRLRSNGVATDDTTSVPGYWVYRKATAPVPDGQ